MCCLWVESVGVDSTHWVQGTIFQVRSVSEGCLRFQVESLPVDSSNGWNVPILTVQSFVGGKCVL